MQIAACLRICMPGIRPSLKCTAFAGAESRAQGRTTHRRAGPFCSGNRVQEGSTLDWQGDAKLSDKKKQSKDPG